GPVFWSGLPLFMPELPQLFLDLFPYLFLFLPIKPDTSGLVLDPHGFHHCRQRRWNPLQHRSTAFPELDLFPIRLDRLFIISHHIAVDVWMSFHQLLAQSMDYIADVESLHFTGDACVKD